MKKTIKTAMLSLAVLAAGFGGVKAYRSISINNENLLMQNVDALSSSAEAGGYTEKSGQCSYPKWKKWVTCERGGEDMCYPSDCW